MKMILCGTCTRVEGDQHVEEIKNWFPAIPSLVYQITTTRNGRQRKNKPSHSPASSQLSQLESEFTTSLFSSLIFPSSLSPFHSLSLSRSFFPSPSSSLQPSISFHSLPTAGNHRFEASHSFTFLFLSLLCSFNNPRGIFRHFLPSLFLSSRFLFSPFFLSPLSHSSVRQNIHKHDPLPLKSQSWQQREVKMALRNETQVSQDVYFFS